MRRKETSTTARTAQLTTLFPAICQGSELTWALMMISGRIREVVFGCGTYDVVVVVLAVIVIVVVKL